MNYSFLVLILIVFIGFSCKNKGGTVKKAGGIDQIQKSKSNLLPELAACDSATVMYYTTPGNPRFFSMTKVYDKTLMGKIDKAVNGKTISGKDSCVTEGKIYFYGKSDVVFPVYFSRYNKDCLTLSFIKTGEKYYTRMPEEVNKLLDEWKKSAKELLPAN